MIDAIPHEHPQMVQFREQAETLCQGFTPREPLEDILIAGACITPQGALSARDAFWGSVVLKELERAGLALTKDFKVKPRNMWDNYDILDPQNHEKAKIFVTAFVVNPDRYPNYENVWFREPGYRTSEHHTKDAWAHSAHRSGAPMVVTFSEGNGLASKEINSSDFVNRYGYVQGPSHDIQVPMFHFDPSKLTTLQMETTYRQDFLEEMANSPNKAAQTYAHQALQFGKVTCG